MGKTFSTGLLTNGIWQDSSNNIGIGAAASGSYKLQVTGTTNLTGALSGTSATFSSTATATAFIPSGATIPTNGMYLSAANTLDFATNTTNRLTIASTGAATFKSTGTTNSILLSSPTNAPTFNIISLNGSVAEGVYIGLVAGGGSNTDLFYQSGNAGSHIFRTGDGSVYTERMRITSGGITQLTGANASVRLEIRNNDGAAYTAFTEQEIRMWRPNGSGADFTIATQAISGTLGAGAIVFTPANVEKMSLSVGGVLKINSLATGTLTSVAGTITSSSDKNLKIDDGTIDSALDKVLKLIPRYFHWKEESTLPTDLRQLGFYAQEVNAALGEEAANTPKENVSWGINDRAIIAFLTKAIQEQQLQIEELKALIAAK